MEVCTEIHPLVDELELCVADVLFTGDLAMVQAW